MSERDVSLELDIELCFCKIWVACLGAGYGQDDLSDAREFVLFGEYAAAVNSLYYLLAQKPALFNAGIRSLVMDLLRYVLPDGVVTEPAAILDLPNETREPDV